MLGYWSLNEASSYLPSWRRGPALVIPVARNNNIPKHQGRLTTYPVWSSVFMFDTSTTFNQERSSYVSCNVRVCSLTALKDPCMILSLGVSQRTKTLVDCASRDETNYASSRETQHIPAFISRQIFFLFEQPYGSERIVILWPDEAVSAGRAQVAECCRTPGYIARMAPVSEPLTRFEGVELTILSGAVHRGPMLGGNYLYLSWSSN